jgi:hypothetical protein
VEDAKEGEGEEMRIWKYRLEVTDTQTLRMPCGARILTVQVQNGVPCLWALVDVSEPLLHPTLIFTVDTGHVADHVSTGAEYVGTYQLHDSGLVFHVFAAKPEVAR